ncbi:hypothetical protein P3S68_027211 [Capsicum galapagoense]
MKLGKNFKTGYEIYLSAWKNDNDPAPGEFTRTIDPTGYPQALTKSGTNVLYRIGPWNGLRWSGAPTPLLTQSRLYTLQFIFNKDELYYIFSLINNSSVLSRFVLSSNGDIQTFHVGGSDKEMECSLQVYLQTLVIHIACVVCNGSCDIYSEPICGCLEKFVPNIHNNGKREIGQKGVY